MVPSSGWPNDLFPPRSRYAGFGQDGVAAALTRDHINFLDWVKGQATDMSDFLFSDLAPLSTTHPAVATGAFARILSLASKGLVNVLQQDEPYGEARRHFSPNQQHEPDLDPSRSTSASADTPLSSTHRKLLMLCSALLSPPEYLALDFESAEKWLAMQCKMQLRYRTDRCAPMPVAKRRAD